jgi:TubC N-terminal docking domain
VTVPDLLVTCQQAGIVLAADVDQLDVDAPDGRLTLDLQAALVAHKPELLAVLWRVQAMRRLAVEAPRALVYARISAHGGPGACFSCGDPLDRPEAYGRCAPCEDAAEHFYLTHADDKERDR